MLIPMEGVTIGDNLSGSLPRIHKWTNKYTLTIGKFCCFAEGVNIIVDGNHRPDWVSTYPLSRLLLNDFSNTGHPEGKGDMVIGNDVWIGMNVMVLPGARIDSGAVVGAGSVVTRHVLPYEVVGGVPARHIKFRFPLKQIARLLEIKWWDWPMEKIVEAIPLLEQDDIEEFIKKYASED